PHRQRAVTAAPIVAAFADVSIGPNRVSLLRDGAQAFPAMLGAIASARSTICLETYILESDETGRRFVKALCERAAAGVEVNLLFDDWGSHVTEDLYALMQEAGVRWVRFMPVRLGGRWAGAFARLRRRNHRKALVVDGEIGFTGG